MTTELHLANAGAAGIGCLLVSAVTEPIAPRSRLRSAAVRIALAVT